MELWWFRKTREPLGAGEWSVEGLSRMETVVDGLARPPEWSGEHTSGRGVSKAL